MRVQAKEHIFCKQCGKRFVFRDSAIKRIDANDYIEWAIRNYQLCPECHAERLTQVALDRADKYSLPKFSGGTKKQISFAAMLRDRYIIANLSLFQQFSEFIADFGVGSIQARAKGNKLLEKMCSIFTESSPDEIIRLLQ